MTTRRLDALTDRQRQIVAMIAGGLTLKEIAAELDLSHQTVKHHVGNASSRLGLTCGRPATRLAVLWVTEVERPEPVPVVLPADVLARVRALADALDAMEAA